MTMNPRLSLQVTSALSALACCAAAWAGEPAVVWISQPVNPGEAVMVYGGPWTEVKTVELSGLDKRTVLPIKVTDDCVTFVYPSDWPLAAFSAQLADSSGAATAQVNTPDVWWLQGDTGKGASPGGWLRAFGRCMGYNGQASLELRSPAGAHRIAAAACDLYALRAELPSDLPAGEYDVFVNNGLGRDSVPAGKVVIAPYHEPWPDKIFNVTDYGAVANDAIDDTRAIRAALADLAKSGGGVLFFPRGRFGMQGTLDLPPRTLLRGEDMALTQIYWLDDDNPSGALISGTRDFGIENLFLAACNIDEGIVVKPPEKEDAWKNANILLRRVRTRFLHTDAGAEEGFRRSRGGGCALKITGDYVRILECDFYFSKGSSALSGNDLLVSGNRFDGPECGYLGGRSVIFENNRHEGRGMSFANGSRGVYLKGNQLGGVYGDGDRETFTFDGGDAAYSDTAVSSAGRSVTLKPGAWRHGQERWIGEPVYIVGGKGAGQMRAITRIDGRTIEIDRPWDIQPDADSYFAIALVRSRLLFIGNHDCDGNPFALYGSASDVVIADNTLERTGGLHAHGMHKGSPEPSWFVQFLGNQIVEGNAFRGPFSYIMPANDSWLGFFDRGIKKPLTYPENRVGIMRRNTLRSNAYLDSQGRVKNLLMENNLVRNADRGAVVESDVQDAILRGNRFENVIRPYAINSRTLISPADRLLAGLSAAEASLSVYLPKEWKQLVSEAEALAKREPPEAESAQAAAGILTRVARALSAQVGVRQVPSATLAALFGLDLAQSSPWLLARLIPNKETKVYLSDAAYPAWSLPATLTATVKPFEGWQIRVTSPAKLVPGEKAALNLFITRPDGPLPVFTLPVQYQLAGDGWAFTFAENYSQASLEVTEFLAVGPFKNASGKPIDTEVHPPEIKLDVTQRYETLDGPRPWVAVKADVKGATDLCRVFKNTEVATAHAVAVVRAARPLQVKVAYGANQNTLAFVNGERIGSSARRDAVRCVSLKAGDNLFHLISSHASGAWPITLTLTAVDPLQPGDLQAVPAEALAQSPALASAAGNTSEGKSLPNALDVDWALLYSDDFNRMRLGSGWTCQSPGWMSQATSLVDGALTSEAGWGFLSFGQTVTPPVRIEFDLFTARGSMAGVYLCPKGLAWHSFWGNEVGRGYCLSLGWHDAKNNRVLRDTATVLLDTKGPQLESGKACHVTAQFVPPRCQLYVDNKLVLEYADAAFLPGLDQLGVFTLGGHRFDNVKIYRAKGK